MEECWRKIRTVSWMVLCLPAMLPYDMSAALYSIGLVMEKQYTVAINKCCLLLQCLLLMFQLRRVRVGCDGLDPLVARHSAPLVG